MTPAITSGSMTSCLPKGSAPLACVDIGGSKVAVSIADERRLKG